MDRAVYNQLLSWQKQQDRMPLLLRGARQVGKTFLVEKLGQEQFKYFHNINFELHPEFKQCFQSLDPQFIISMLEGMTGQRVSVGESLLFFDEVQLCPEAISALRYFKEKIPKLHVIAAGSLLEFALRNEQISMPVGRVEYIWLKPLSFLEFLQARGFSLLIEHIRNVTIESPVAEPIHNKLIDLMKEYLLVGGMPAAVKSYLSELNFQEVARQQSIICATYRDDFAKYAKVTDHKYLQKVFERAPALIGQHIGYHKIDEHSRSRDLRRAIHDLSDAGVLQTVYSTTASGLPLHATINEKRLKLLYLDVGLMNRLIGVSFNELINSDITLLTKGAMAEQFVGQELQAYNRDPLDPSLYYWERSKAGSQAEVDYIISRNAHIIPIEVKAGATGSLKSLHRLLEERELLIGIRVSEKPLGLDKNILSIPFYLISEIERLYFSAI